MIYNIICDGMHIYDATSSMAILNPQLDLEVNAAGTLTFTMMPGHTYYDAVLPFISDIEVYEEDNLLFFGRVIDTTIDFMNRKKVTCEGALGYFNDTVQPPRVWQKPDPSKPDDPNEEIYLSDFLDHLIDQHNKLVTLPNRQFKMGNFTLTDKKVSRELSYEKTIDCIKTMCIDAEGGYIIPRKEDDGIYLDWLVMLPGVSSQPIQYALNLTDLTQDFKGSTLITCILPIGKDDLNLRSLNPDGTYTEVNERNPGQLYVDSDAVEDYGRIMEQVDFDDIDDKQKLYDQAVKWLEDNQFETVSINVNAADLYYFNPDYSTFQIGDLVHVVSNPHLIDKSFPIVKISYKLDSPLKNITIGTVPRQSLTEIYSGGGGGGGKGSVTKSQVKRIASKEAEQKITEDLGLKIDDTDNTLHVTYGTNPEEEDSLLLDETGIDIAEELDAIAYKVLHISEYLQPEVNQN